MASLGDVGTSSFDAYEGIRIFIPGAVTYALTVFVLGTIAPGIAGKVRDDAVVSLIASIMIGLILYYWDIPAKAAAQYQDQPTTFLEEKYPNKAPTELVSAYLEILNTLVPPTIRNRALYMGSMYRIGLELILGLSTASAVVLLYSQWNSFPDLRSISFSSPRLWATITVLAAFTFAFTVSVGYQRKVDFRTRRTSRGLLLGSLRSLWHRTMWVYVLGLLLIAGGAYLFAPRPPLELVSHSLETIGSVVCFGYWIIRYVRGDRGETSDPRKRIPIAAPASAALLVLPLGWVLLSRGYDQADPLIGGRFLAAWTSILCVTVLSIILRGHERKLHGSYIGQRRWLEHNLKLCAPLIDPPSEVLQPKDQVELEAQIQVVPGPQPVSIRSYLSKVVAAIRNR